MIERENPGGCDARVLKAKSNNPSAPYDAFAQKSQPTPKSREPRTFDSAAPYLGEPSVAALALVDGQRLEFIAETLDFVGSYALSAREAAWRDDRPEFGVRLRQLLDCLHAAIQTFNELEPGAGA